MGMRELLKGYGRKGKYMSAIRPFSWGRYGRVPDAPEPEERDCEKCKRNKLVKHGDTWYQSCKVWECEFEPIEEDKE